MSFRIHTLPLLIILAMIILCETPGFAQKPGTPLFAAIGNDGERLLLAESSRFSLIDASTSQTLYRSPELASPITVVAVCDKGELAAAGCRDGKLLIYSHPKGTAREFSSSSAKISHLAFSASGRLLAVSQQDSVRILDGDAGWSEVIAFSHPEIITGIAWQKEKLLTICADGGVRSWDLKSRRPTLLFASDRPLIGLDTAKESELVVFANATGALYQLADGRLSRIFLNTPPRKVDLRGIALSGDGRWLAISYHKTPWLQLDLRLGEVIEGQAVAKRVEYTNDGNRVLILSEEGYSIRPRPEEFW